MALLSGGTRIALTSNVFLPRASRFQTTYSLTSQGGTNGKMAGQT
jgi:hypothetical protein